MRQYNTYTSAEQLLKQISGMQSQGTRHFREGIFPVYRELPVFFYRRADDNIYYSTLILLILQNALPFLSAADQKLALQIIQKVSLNFNAYRSRSGEPVYGFYRTEPGGHYPHGWLLHRFDSLKLPDDADDTALIYLAQKHTQQDALFLKKKLAYHSNLKRGRRVKRTMPEFENWPAYSTWFGSDKVYVDFDMGVMSNILWFVFVYGLPLNEHDEASLRYLYTCLEKRYYLTHTYLVSPWYPDSDVILYHMARMVEDAHHDELAILKEKLIAELSSRLQENLHPLRRLFLATATMRLTNKPVEAPLQNILSKPALMNGFTWGATPILYTIDWIYNMGSRRIQKISSSPALNYRFQCPAHNNALLLEYWTYLQKTSA